MSFFILSTLLVGAVAFLGGFLGPIVIQPDANQGPLLGILITGPLGLILGAALGFVLPRVFDPKTCKKLLFIVTALIGLGIPAGLYMFQEPEVVGRLYSAEITEARPASDEITLATDKWQNMAKRYPNAPQTGWQEDRKNRVLQAKGTIVTLTHASAWIVYRQRRPWNRGDLSFRPQEPGAWNQGYFAADTPIPPSGWFLSKTRTEPDEWPPKNVATFLGFQELLPAPPDLRPPGVETPKPSKASPNP